MNSDSFTENEISEEEYFENLKKTLTAFATDLSEKQGLKSNTVNRHVARLDFFAESFLYHKDIEIQHLHAEDMIDFLGEYYIRKVLSSNKSDVSPYLTTFKKFAKFAYEHEYIDKEDFDEIKMVCKQKDYFRHRFDTYFSSEDLEEWFFDNNLYAYLEEQEEADYFPEDNDEAFQVDTHFVRMLEKKNMETPAAVLAFSNFLEKIQNEGSVKLTKARQHITRNFWKELDQQLDLQLFHKPTLNQEDIGVYHYFYLLGKQLKLYRISGDKLIPTKQLTSFQKLSTMEKYVLMVDGLWNQLSWRDIQPSSAGGRIEVTQSRRSKLAGTLSQFPVGKEVELRDSRLGLTLIQQTFFGGLGGSLDHFFEYIMPILEFFDVFQLGYEWIEKKHFSDYELISVELKEIGLVTFNQLKKMGNALPESAPSDMISDLFIQMGRQPVIKNEKVGRNDPCPCGSGKKYKRCCM